MKYLKRIFIAALLLFVGTSTFAQKKYLDSLSIEIEDKMKIEMSIYDYYELKETVEKDLKSLQEILKVNESIPENSPFDIVYEPNKKLTIKDSESTEKIIWKNGKQMLYQFNNTCEILGDDYRLHIEYNSLENLISRDLVDKLGEVIANTSEIENRYSTTYHYSFSDENMVHNEELNNVTGGSDMLSITTSVGANLIKNQPVIDLNFKAGFVFSKKGILKNEYFVTYNLLYDFVNNSEFNINSFLGLGFRHNMSNDKDDSDWLGLELGYLVSKNGDMFDENTFRVGLNWEVGNLITVSPQLYISGEQTYPGLRIGFGF